jgi:hypothetical protein
MKVLSVLSARRTWSIDAERVWVWWVVVRVMANEVRCDNRMSGVVC